MKHHNPLNKVFCKNCTYRLTSQHWFIPNKHLCGNWRYNRATEVMMYLCYDNINKDGDCPDYKPKKELKDKHKSLFIRKPK